MTVLLATKGSDQSVTSSIVLANESALTIAMGASDLWYLTWTLIVTCPSSSGNGGIRLGYSLPTGATATVSAWATDSTATPHQQYAAILSSGTNLLNEGATVITSPLTVTMYAVIKGDGTHSGTITLQFAQAVSNATATTIKSGSSLKALA